MKTLKETEDQKESLLKKQRDVMANKRLGETKEKRHIRRKGYTKRTRKRRKQVKDRCKPGYSRAKKQTPKKKEIAETKR
jgi:hypothetical protein